MSKTSRCLLAAIVAAAMGSPTTPADASDFKIVTPSACQAYAPDTSAAELQFSPSGVYNPGASTEKVMCAMPRDQFLPYAADGDMNIIGYYRVLGAVAGRMTCSVFVGSASFSQGVVQTATKSGPFLSNGQISYVQIAMPMTPELSEAPVNVICALPPRSQLGNIRFTEKDIAE